MDNIDIVWNNAVSKVGGMQNTMGNFSNIVNEFAIQAEQAGFTQDEVKKEVQDNFKATCGFMQ